MRLDLILAADALRPPLTGIGRYTFELARRLKTHEDVARLRYFSMGQWIDDPLAALIAREEQQEQPASAEADRADGADQADGAATPALSTPSPPPTLRDRLANSRLAVRVYAALTPAFFGWRLRGNKRAIYHAPNYIVPYFGGKTVSTVHDLSHLLYPQFHPRARVDYLNAALPKSLARTDRVIAVTEAVRQEMIEHRLMPADRITTIHEAASAAFRPHAPHMLEPAMRALGLRAGRYTLFVGTVEPRKNVQRLIQAYERLPLEMRQHWPLVIAGGQGWNSQDTHARIAQAQEQGWVRYVAYVDQRWLPALYAGARLMVYPSIYEGFGLPIVEAMASGTPVITSNTSCMPEVAAGAARLIDPLDVEDIAHALSQCLQDNIWQANARHLGLARAAQLSWDRCAKETVALYQQLV